MNGPSLVLWTLDNGYSPRDFERLCVDLLGREGYWKIAPIGGMNDQGRDAEAVYWQGKSERSTVVVFQFSLQENWEKKLKTDAEKIKAHCRDAIAMVFITSRTVTGEKQSKLVSEFKTTYGWTLSIYSREWLRMRLEEVYPDLARKYLNVDLPETVCSIASRIETVTLDGTTDKELFRDKNPDLVRASILESTRKEPTVAANWKRLTRIEIYLENYKAALEAVNQALELEPEDINFRLLKGTNLAELGIEANSMPLLIQAKDIFVYAVTKLKRPADYYNLANILAPLGDLDGAESNYLRCLEAEPKNAQAWKNLGTLYTKKSQHEKGMECFDKALAIRPDLIEAHLSKANTWLIFFQEPDKAVACFKTAYELEPLLDKKWRHGRYWYSRALCLAGQHEAGLRQAELGLRDHPDDRYLLNQKAGILRHLWPRKASYVTPAYEFFAFRAQCIRNDYPGLVELIKLCSVKSAATDAWTFVDMNLERGPYSLRDLAELAGITIIDFQAGFEVEALYQQFRSHSSLLDHGYTLNNHGLEPNPAMLPALNQMVLAPFGVIARHLKARAIAKETDDLPAVFEALLDQLSNVFAVFGPDWLGEEKPIEKAEQT